ncbi:MULTISPECIES: hypothetical protein [Acinetobacter]|uniref:Uncharacterized protein n=1 Tax=Acinetobacter corruptisaponis TaxID=3045147 RepID=A0ABY8S2N9_9GAMM|nr:hypothetical protein [Acinetobacter sp. KCTC 92772]WHP04777.1 hypothetical protein QLH32_12010 [Acinetobacter sp. KCTC 92772]
MSSVLTLTTLDLNGLDLDTVGKALFQQLIIYKVENAEIKVPAQFVDKAQAVINRLASQMPDLIPVQFHYMLNKYGFDDAIAVLLPNLKLEDLDKYAMYKAYLEQARFYEFSKTLEMFNDIQDKFTAIDENLNFNVEQLKAMWQEASQI